MIQELLMIQNGWNQMINYEALGHPSVLSSFVGGGILLSTTVAIIFSITTPTLLLLGITSIGCFSGGYIAYRAQTNKKAL